MNEETHARQASERIHRGTFAEGVADRRPHPERWPSGDFAIGLGMQDSPERTHRGTFAEGLLYRGSHPELELEGDFARGQADRDAA